MPEWNPPVRFAALAQAYPGECLCRVTAQERGRYRLWSAEGQCHGQVSGRFMYEADGPAAYPAVGDYVTTLPWQGEEAVIQRVLPRNSVFIRKAAGTRREEQAVAANVDILFVCMALNRDFNLRRLERYMALGWESGALPVVVLTKGDLCPEREALLLQARRAAPGVEVLVTSAAEADGYKALLPYLEPGKTAAFVGSSGVGKSTLMNCLMGQERQLTGAVGEDGRGRHTTTRRELLCLPGGAMLIDTPGMRELGLWEAEEGLTHAFADMEALAARCRFHDCTHTGEPGCALRQALERGELEEKRYRSYLKLLEENRQAAMGRDYLAAKEKKFKQIAKTNKTNRKK